MVPTQVLNSEAVERYGLVWECQRCRVPIFIRTSSFVAYLALVFPFMGITNDKVYVMFCGYAIYSRRIAGRFLTVIVYPATSVVSSILFPYRFRAAF